MMSKIQEQIPMPEMWIAVYHWLGKWHFLESIVSETDLQKLIDDTLTEKMKENLRIIHIDTGECDEEGEDEYLRTCSGI